jgi:hypothetical protein
VLGRQQRVEGRASGEAGGGEGKDNNNGGYSNKEEPCGLSGVSLLYVGGGGLGGEGDDVAAVDAKTIWGQVDMQINVLVLLLRERMRKSAGHCSGERDKEDIVHILHMDSGSNN